MSALDALKEGNLQLLLDLLNVENSEEEFDVDKAYPEEKFKTLLHVAVEKQNVEAVKYLCTAGADVNAANRLLQTTAIHVAARKGNVEIMRILLANKANPNAVTADGKAPIHILAKKCAGDCGNESLKRCLKLLLNQKDLEVDKRDSSGGQTALHAVAVSDVLDHLGFVELVSLFLIHGADFSLKCDGDEGQTIREIVKEKVNPREFQNLLDLSDISAGPGSISSAIRNDLMNLINEAELGRANYDAFEAALNLAQKSDLASNNPGEPTLIQRACEVGLTLHVQALLARGADPNLVPKGTTPALIAAAKNGHSEVIKIMKEHKLGGTILDAGGTDFSIVDGRSRTTVLHSILRKPFSDEGTFLSADKTNMEERYTQCLRVILEDCGDAISTPFEHEIRKVINALDEMGNTSLHYATQMWPQSIVRLLLEKGANIGMRNAYNEIPVENILPETMEAFLDEFCLTSEGDLTNKDFKVTVRYDFLAPTRDLDDFEEQDGSSSGKKQPLQRMEGGWTGNGIDAEKQHNSSFDSGTGGNGSYRLPLPETEVLWYMSQSKRHRHLLKHPVITSFLWMKWKRIASSYNKNLLFYFTFVICLTAYIFVLYGGRSLRAKSVLWEQCGGGEGPEVNGSSSSEASALDLPVEVDVLWYLNTIFLIILAIR